jgi:hypothetical protein
MNPLGMIANYAFRQTLSDKGPAITIARLCTSRHLGDLQLIAPIALLVMVAAIIIVIIVLFKNNPTEGAAVGAYAAAAAAVLNWTYQTGSKRIGVVDLFAVEITSICGVSLIADFARSSVERAKHHGEGAMKFTSEEHYTPVYDSQLSDLQPLDFNVVRYVTQFYTYRKAMIDYIRATAAAEDSKARADLICQMIYMQFLMYESGRLAITELIEFEPNQAESLVIILCSELVTYAFLQKHYGDDFRGKRLRLRLGEYNESVEKLIWTINEHRQPVWEKARTTAEELIERYNAMCRDLGVEPSKLFLRRAHCA